MLLAHSYKLVCAKRENETKRQRHSLKIDLKW